MTCPQCQLPNPVSATYCARCGAPLSSAPVAPAPIGASVSTAGGERHAMAITARVRAILSPLVACVLVGLVTGLVALVLGIMAMSRANRQPGLYGGKTPAIIGAVLGGLTLLFPPVGAALAVP